MRTIEDMRALCDAKDAEIAEQKDTEAAQLRRELALQRETWGYFEESMISKDSDIKRLREVAFCAALFLQAVSEYNERLPEEKALGTAMAYGKEAGQLSDALGAL